MRPDGKRSEKTCRNYLTKSYRILIVKKPTRSVSFYAAGVLLVPVSRSFRLELIGIIRQKPAGIRRQGNNRNAMKPAGSGRGAMTWVDLHLQKEK